MNCTWIRIKRGARPGFSPVRNNLTRNSAQYAGPVRDLVRGTPPPVRRGLRLTSGLKDFCQSLGFKSFPEVSNRAGAFSNGVSLIELLVVIAIIALLLSILSPSLGKAKSAAMRLKCAHNLKQIHLAMFMYLNGNNGTYPCAEDPVSNDPNNPYWLWMGRGWRSFVEPYLGGGIDANHPSVLFCPQDPVSKDNFESTSYAYSMAFYHSPEQIDNMNSVSDQWGDNNPPVHCVRQRSPNVARPSQKILIGEWLSNHLPVNGKDPGWWDWQGTRNYLFADGQVLFLEAAQIREANDGNPNPNLTRHGIRGIDWPR